METTIKFPEWNPQKYTKNKFTDSDFTIRYYALRTSSSNFISKKEVRLFIFDRDNYQCVSCGNKENLQIDHIISVYTFAQEQFPFLALNGLQNLQTLCIGCHNKKPTNG